MILRNTLSIFCFIAVASSVLAGSTLVAQEVHQANGVKIGEVTSSSAVVWTRITSNAEMNRDGISWPKLKKLNDEPQIPRGKSLADMTAAVEGANGSVRLHYWLEVSPEDRVSSEWTPVDADADFTHQFKLAELKAGSRYELELVSRGVNKLPGAKVSGRFRTAPGKDERRNISFTVVTGQDYPRRDDSENGHKIYPLMHKLDPDFFIHTGDIEYYDKPEPFATNVQLARFKWNRLFALPYQRDFQNVTASYFIKDDHDTLKNDAWPGQTYGDLTWEQGLAIFREQTPVDGKTYRTIRWGKDLQIWLVEGRDYRSSNRMPDGPEKTIWGKEQKEWFFETVSASDATFKLLISPTPLVGPDRTNKGDNHANAAFAHEGRELRAFIGKQKNMFVCCGDRHWQYVSVEPESGVREFSCGPTSNKHASGWSNDKRSPMHRYLNVVGGFLSVTIDTETEAKPVAVFRHYSTEGKVLNEDRQVAR